MTIKAESEYLYRFVSALFFIVQVSNWKSGSRGSDSVFEVLIEGGPTVMQAIQRVLTLQVEQQFLDIQWCGDITFIM